MRNFRKYLKKLQELDIEDTLIGKGRTVLLISGSSNYESAALSYEQKEFLKIFEEYGYKIIDSNFPYNKKFENKKYDDVSIIRASISNIIYYIHTLYNRDFQKEIRRHMKFLMDREDIIVVSQSSGLNMLKILNRDNLDRIKIFALGPVATGRRKTENMTVIKGKKDIYTRTIDFHEEDRRVDCGHFNYLINNEIKEKICEELQKDKN